MDGMGAKNINAKSASGEGSRGNEKHDIRTWQKGDPCCIQWPKACLNSILQLDGK